MPGKPPFLLHTRVQTINGKLQKGGAVDFSLAQKLLFPSCVRSCFLARAVVVRRSDDGGGKLRIVVDRPDVEVVRVLLRTRRQPLLKEILRNELPESESSTLHGMIATADTYEGTAVGNGQFVHISGCDCACA